MGERILITGHKGLIGSNLRKHITNQGDEVIVIEERLQDIDAINRIFSEKKPSVVYHLAANAAEARGQVSPKDMTDNNLIIFINVLNAAINHGVKRFIYTSSVAVYGEATIPYVENGPTRPKDVYGVNKLACEQILKIMSKVYGFEYVIVRPHNVYGPGQNMSDPYRNVVALFMRRILENKSYKLYGDGRMQRAFSYVDDVVDVLSHCKEDRFKNRTVNIGSDNAVSIKLLSDAIQEISGRKVEVEMAEARPQEITMFLADHELQRSLVQYKNTSLWNGLKKTWEWVLSQELLPLIQKEDEIVYNADGEGHS